MKGRHGKVDLAVLGAMMKDRWDKPFALASIPIDALNFQDIADSGEERIARAERYARMDTPLPPALASYRGGRRNAPRAYVTDGNHRVLAATLRGNRTALVYIPVDDLYRLRDDATRIGLVTGMIVESRASRSSAVRTRVAVQNPSPSMTAPASVRRMLRRGLALVAAGRAGKGLRGETTAWARDLADGLPVTPAKARKMRAWFARHGATKAESARRMRDAESPAAVAWLLWGGDPTVAYRRTGWRDPVAGWLRRVLG